MNQNATVDVNTVIAIACAEFGYSERDLHSNAREAIKKKIRRYMADLGWSRPYRLTEREAERLVSIDLRAYFLKAFGMFEQVTEARQKMTRAKQELRLRQYYLNHARPHEEREEVQLGLEYELPEAKFDSVRSRAIFRKLFPSFDEERFLKEYREWCELEDYLGSLITPDKTEYLALAVRLHELSGRLKPAFEFGDIDAYLVTGRDE